MDFVRLRLGRNPVAWTVLFTLLWGTILGVYGSCFASFRTAGLSLIVSHDTEAEEHAKFCHCLSCPGGKKCCCLSLKDEAGKLAMRAVCDDGTTLAGATFGGVALRPSSLNAPLPIFVSVLPVAAPAPRRSAPSRLPLPLISPPRFLS